MIRPANVTPNEFCGRSDVSPIDSTQTPAMAEHAFVVPQRSASLLAGGATPDEIRGPRYVRRSHGLLLPADVEGDAVQMRIADAVGLMTSSCLLGGWASLRAQGNTWFDGLDAHGDERRAMIHCQPGSQLRHRSIIQAFRGVVHPDEIVDFENFSLTTMARAAFDEMRMAKSVREAVVVLDLATSTTIAKPHTTIERVERVILSHHKVRGLVQARQALTLGSSRSASPWRREHAFLPSLTLTYRDSWQTRRFSTHSEISSALPISSTRKRDSSSNRTALTTGRRHDTQMTTVARRSSSAQGWSSPESHHWTIRSDGRRSAALQLRGEMLSRQGSASGRRSSRTGGGHGR